MKLYFPKQKDTLQSLKIRAIMSVLAFCGSVDSFGAQPGQKLPKANCVPLPTTKAKTVTNDKLYLVEIELLVSVTRRSINCWICNMKFQTTTKIKITLFKIICK